MSLRGRLVLALLATVVTALGTAGALTYTLVARSQVTQVDDDLQRAESTILNAFATAGSESLDVRDLAPGFYAEVRDASGRTIVVASLRDRDGDVLTLEGRSIETPAVNGASSVSTITVEDDEVLRVRSTLAEDGSVLITGRSLEDLLHTRRRLFSALAATAAAVTVIAGGLAFWTVRLGLRPLNAVEQAAALVEDDPTRRVPGDDAPTEVGQLARTINRMLERLEGAFRQRDADLAALQESEARMRRFVADASHELRTPIAATSAYAELFERGARDRPDDLARAMAGIRNETARMTDLVEDLLLLSKLDEGRRIEFGDVDLGEVVADAVDAARAVAPDRPVTVEPVADEAMAVVTGDHGQLRQIVDNLLANVRTHTPPGAACTVGVVVDGDEAVLSVGDSGPGMSAVDAARAFDRFHRADRSRARASGGSGLGLSIVAALVEAHGGTVSLTSSVDAGTTVTIRLPLAHDRTGGATT